jgi:hypothetical protein
VIVIIYFKCKLRKYYKIKAVNPCVMWLPILAIWGCIPELTKNCVDMTNSSSTYLGIVGGAAIGAVIAWWIYNRQKKTSRKQDYILERIENIEEKNRRLLTELEEFAKHHDKILNELFLLNQNILALEKKIEKHGSRDSNQSKAK